MFILNNTFFWQGVEILKHQLVIDETFIKENKIERVSAGELILIFEHYYGIDIGDYGLMDVIIDKNYPNLTIHLMGIDHFRQLQLNKLIS